MTFSFAVVYIVIICYFIRLHGSLSVCITSNIAASYFTFFGALHFLFNYVSVQPFLVCVWQGCPRLWLGLCCKNWGRVRMVGWLVRNGGFGVRKRSFFLYGNKVCFFRTVWSVLGMLGFFGKLCYLMAGFLCEKKGGSDMNQRPFGKDWFFLVTRGFFY